MRRSVRRWCVMEKAEHNRLRLRAFKRARSESRWRATVRGIEPPPTRRPHGTKASDAVWQHAVSLLSSARRRARKTRRACSLTLEWVTAKLDTKVCAATGIAFKLGRGKRTAWSPSIDKIDPRGGYTPENCRVVVWIYNAAKSEFTDDAVLILAGALATEDRMANLTQRILDGSLHV